MWVSNFDHMQDPPISSKLITADPSMLDLVSPSWFCIDFATPPGVRSFHCIDVFGASEKVRTLMDTACSGT